MLHNCWPAFCDVSKANYNKLLNIEVQAMMLCGSAGPNMLGQRLDRICIRLMHQLVKYNEHPLRSLFVANNDTNYNLRHRFKLLTPTYKSSTLLKTFISYYKHS